MLTTEHSLTPRQHLMATLFIALAIVPHVIHLPTPISLLLLFLLFWRFMTLHYTRLQPGRWILVVVTMGGIFLVFNQFHTLIGRDAGVALLTVMMMLKILETRKRQDIYNAVFISYFVIITHFLFNQSMAMALYLSIIMICLTALLIEINRIRPSQQSYKSFL
ncbi:MAG: transglutaminaseTgpA domain-containing protein, partial [Candidatus Thiodiazotropha sp. 6PLUC10]